MAPEPLRDALAILTPLIGDWDVHGHADPGYFPDGFDMHGVTTFSWALGGAFLEQTSTVDVPEAPDAHCFVEALPDRTFIQHYFDSRGVVREYAMTFDGRVWTLERHPRAPGFGQRFRGELSDDGTEIAGAWEAFRDGAFALDFAVTYRRR